jgi:hypothetical protein
VPEGEWFCGEECVSVRRALDGEVEAGEVAVPGNPAYVWQIMRGRSQGKAVEAALKTCLEILQASRAGESPGGPAGRGGRRRLGLRGRGWASGACARVGGRAGRGGSGVAACRAALRARNAHSPGRPQPHARHAGARAVGGRPLRMGLSA